MDIISPTGTAVDAIEDGTIFRVSPPSGGSGDYLAGITNDHGWNYIHATQIGGLASGNPLVAGRQIATVSTAPTPVPPPPFPAYPAHLHIDYTSNLADPGYVPSSVLRPVGNPLDYLTSQDSTAPTVVADGFRFRPASFDNGPVDPGVTNSYFFQPLGNMNIPFVGAMAPTRDSTWPFPDTGIGSADIDVISNVYDQVVAGGRHLAPRSVSFRIQGDTPSIAGDDTGWVYPCRTGRGPIFAAGEVERRGERIWRHFSK